MDEEVFSDFDFSNLCRFCLTKDVEMMDLFETGIYDAITSATRLEVGFILFIRLNEENPFEIVYCGGGVWQAETEPPPYLIYRRPFITNPKILIFSF